jgi:hypothetical protein
MLTRTVYGHCKEAGPMLPWLCSRQVCPAVSMLTTDSHPNRRVCRAAPCRTPTIYATATSMNIFSPKRMNTNTYTIAVYKRDIDHVFYNHRNQKLTTQKLCETMWWSYSPKEILNGGSCVTNLTIRSNRFQIKLKLTLNETRTDSQNGFTSLRYIFFLYKTHVSTIYDCGNMKRLWKSF